MLYNHNDWSRPIGRWENIRIEGGKILADPVFDMEDKRENGGAEIASQVERDFIRMASIGAWPPDEVDDDPYRWTSGQYRPQSQNGAPVKPLLLLAQITTHWHFMTRMVKFSI